MNRPSPGGLVHSIQARLKNEAHETGRPFVELLELFAVERFLHRLGRSEHREHFILKGALLLRHWLGAQTRPPAISISSRGQTWTRRGFAVSSASFSWSTWRRTASSSSSIRSSQTRSASDPRSSAFARSSTRSSDIRGSVTRSTLGWATLCSRRWRRSSQADCSASRWPVSGPTLPIRPLRRSSRQSSNWARRTAVSRTTSTWCCCPGHSSSTGRRSSNRSVAPSPVARQPSPSEPLDGLSDAFAQNPINTGRWLAFLEKGRLTAVSRDLGETVARIRSFAQPAMDAAREGRPFVEHWPPGGPWR